VAARRQKTVSSPQIVPKKVERKEISLKLSALKPVISGVFLYFIIGGRGAPREVFTTQRCLLSPAHSYFSFQRGVNLVLQRRTELPSGIGNLKHQLDI